jgi:amino acid transporter
VNYFAEQAIVFTFVVGVALMNLLGLDLVVRSQAVAFVVSLMPCLLFIFMGLPALRFEVILSLNGPPADWALLASWALWLYSGFASLGSMAGEIDRPRRTYPAVISLLLPLTLGLNLLSFGTAISLDPITTNYAAGYFSNLARKLSGDWLMALLVAGANISLLGLYHSQILTAERTLWMFAKEHGLRVMGEKTEHATKTAAVNVESDDIKDFCAGNTQVVSIGGWLLCAPSGGGVPRGIILMNAVCAGMLSRVDLGSLVMVEMMITSVSTILFLYAFIAMRTCYPDMPRPFRLPGGHLAGIAYTIPPFILCGITLGLNFMSVFNAIAFTCVIGIGLLGHALGKLVLLLGISKVQTEGTLTEECHATTGV